MPPICTSAPRLVLVSSGAQNWLVRAVNRPGVPEAPSRERKMKPWDVEQRTIRRSCVSVGPDDRRGAAGGRVRPEGHRPKERLPGDLNTLVGAVGDRGERVPGEDTKDGVGAVGGWLAAGVRDDERLAAWACPQHGLPVHFLRAAGRELVRGELVLGQDRLSGAGGELGDPLGGGGDDPGAVGGEERVEAEGSAVGEGEDDLG